MIITEHRRGNFSDNRVTWNRLRRFQNVAHVASLLSDLHSIPERHRRNVPKQASQIRYCLTQAAEYFAAADAVTLATKPVLLYYGVMSMALAEILFKQDGGSSLDSARGENAHHGLDLRVHGDPSKVKSLLESASRLREKPLVVGKGDRRGTFELWHRSSREAPICAPFLRDRELGVQNEGVHVFAVARDQRLTPLIEDGVTLLDCCRALPYLREALEYNGVSTEIVRARIRIRTRLDNSSIVSLTVQPDSMRLVPDFANLFGFRSFEPKDIQIEEWGDGFLVRWSQSESHPTPHFRLPIATQIGAADVYFCTNNESLNEFGLLYVATYILGNYARYFPEQWMTDVESASSLAVVAETLIAYIEQRAPLLLLSELERCWHIEAD